MGINPFIPKATTTIENVISAYLGSLESRGASSHYHISRVLTKAMQHFGKDTNASEISPAMVCDFLGSIYSRGSEAMADRAHSILKACFNHSIKSPYNYRTKAFAVNGITSNPLDMVPADRKASSHVCNRFLTKEELSSFLVRLENDSEHPASKILRLCVLIGSRLIESASLKVSSYNPETKVLKWETTKTGVPHQICVNDYIHSFMMEWIKGKEQNDFIFPSMKNSMLHTSVDTVQKYFDRLGFKDCTSRDACRRTFKVWIQSCAVSKELADRLQNHSDRSVSSRHYDRHFMCEDGMKEMQNAFDRWVSFLNSLSKFSMVA